MSEYIKKTICAKPLAAEGPFRFMKNKYELRPGVRAEPIVENAHVQDMGKTCFSMYHIPTRNVVLQYLVFRDEREYRHQSITLFGSKEDIGEVEKIVLGNIND